jgi:hypothetical protein
MYYIINGDEQWIGVHAKPIHPMQTCTCHIQCTEWQIELDLTAAPATILQNPEAAVAALSNIPLACPRAAAASIINNPPAPIAVGLTVIKMAVNGTNPRAIMVVIRAQDATR